VHSRRLRTALALLIIVVVMCVCSIPVGYYSGRPLPLELRKEIFSGAVYSRSVRFTPRMVIIHILTIDLTVPGIGFLVTPGDPGAQRPLDAMTTSQFLERYDLQIAINGDGFTPWNSDSLLEYYPHVGDPVTPNGFSSSEGVIYKDNFMGRPTLNISKEGDVYFGVPHEPVYNAISGDELLVDEGKPIPGLDDSIVAPRSAVGISLDGEKMILVVADGRQPLYSVGLTLAELAQVLISYGANNAMSLDGGGSSTLVVEGSSGHPLLLNSPIDLNIPGRERAVGNHLGIYIP